MSVIRSGDADDIDAVAQELRNGIRSGEGGEGAETGAVLLTEAVSAGAGAAGDSGKVDLDGTEFAPVERLAAQLLEDRAIGVVEDHAESDHAGPDRRRVGGVHVAMLANRPE